MLGHLETLLVVNQVGKAIGHIWNTGSYLGFIIYIFLIVSSITCWSIVIKKVYELRLEKKRAAEFRRLFKAVEGNIVSLSQEGIIPGNSPARLFVSAYEELRLWATFDRERNCIVTERVVIPALERTLDRSIETEKQRWERGTTVLATISGAGPLMGLLGTVWGIFNSFQQMSETGNASLTSVGAGISEALLTTAVGLVVAIPAMISYNLILRSVRNIENELDGFAIEIINNFDRQIVVNPSMPRNSVRTELRKKSHVPS